MSKNNARNYYIRNVNTHLLNVLENSYYIEVGSVSLNLLDRLLKGQILELKDLVYIKTLNEGIGKITSDLSNDYDYQLNYLLSFRQKSSTHKFFLTAGLLKYRDESGLEKFAPIVLIPIDIDYQKRKIRLSSEPILNRLLMRMLAKYKFNKQEDQNKYIDAQSSIRLNSSYAIDKVCEELAEYFKLSVTPINFLTICNVEYYDFDIKKDFFSPERSIYESKEINLYNDYFTKVKAILPANLHQKHAILRAHNGESFAVDGKLGSGKTYTAINIIADAISSDKKILYVNQDLDNVWEIEKNMKYFGLDNLVVNLTTKTSNIEVEPVILPTDISNNFDFEPIKFFDKLEEARHKRIGGFTFDYLIENQAILKRIYPDIKEIDLEVRLERYEYGHVKQLLKTIEEKLKVINNFNDNVWRGLQPGVTKMLPSEIIQRLTDFYNFHRTLTKTIDSYCKAYNLKEPKNIHDLNNLIDHVLSFESAKPQPSWKTKEDRNKARLVLKEIQEAIDENYIAMDYYKNNLDKNYKPGRMLDILTEILGKHLSITNDEKYINNIFANNQELDVLTNTILENNKIAKLEFNNLYSYFGFKTDELIPLEFIKDLLIYLKTNSLPRQLATEYINNKKNALFVGSIVYKNYQVIRLIKDEINAILLPNTKFTYIEAIELIEDAKTKKRLSNFFDYALMRRNKVDKDELIKKISDYYHCAKNIINVLEIKDSKVEVEKYWQECSNFYELVSKHSEFSKNFDMFIKKQTSLAPIAINKVTGTLNTLITCSENADKYIEALKEYNINIKKDYPVEKINELSSWTGYLVKTINLRNETYQFINKTKIRFNDIIELIEQDNNHINLLDKLTKHEPEYLRLLGDNYNKFDTIIGDTGISIDHFDDFIEKLNDPDDVDNLLRTKTFEKFVKDTMKLRNIQSEWFTFYRLFSVCFTHGQPYCQTAPFKDVLEMLKDFISKSDEIDSVITIIGGLNEVAQYGLNNLVEQISKGSLKENLSASFCYTLYSQYISEFDKNDHILIDFNWIKSEFDEFEKNEQNYCLNNIVYLKRLSLKKNKAKNVTAAFYEYNKFIDGTIKYNNLYLADLNIFNADLDVSKFDLVIIDDCHLSSANKYNRIASCKQVILLGDKSFQSSVSNSLLQRVGDYSVIQYANRYVKMTPKFNNVWNNANRYIYSYETSVNINSVKSVNEFGEKIVEYFTKNPQNVLNVLIGNEETRREVYIAVVTILNMSYSYMDVIEILTYHIRLINVNDEGSKYVNDVFIYYTDFIEYDLAQKNLIFKNFVVVENSVQIYYLENKVESLNKEIEQDISKTMVKAVVKPKAFDGIAKLFYDDLVAHGIKVKTGFGKFDITIQKSSKHPIAIIFEGSRDSNAFSVIDDYHYYYRQYLKRGWDIKVIYTYDLIDNYDKIFNKLLSEIEGKVNK